MKFKHCFSKKQPGTFLSGRDTGRALAELCNFFLRIGMPEQH